mgnify:CR=1 FL=1
MRKILLIVVIILLLVFGYMSVIKGITIGNMHISSIKQIDENSKMLETKIEELNSLIDIVYPKKMGELKEVSNKMQETKQKYLDETNFTSDEELQTALQIESYDIERLYVKLGVHAKKEGVKIKFTLTSASIGDIKDLSFTVEGTYVAITNFLYAIEDDEELKFRIYNFKLVPYESSILQATFTVKNVRITSNSLNTNLRPTDTSEETSDNKNENNTNTTKQ